jgi:hypothetical protein
MKTAVLSVAMPRTAKTLIIAIAPALLTANDAGRQQNRRVEMVVSGVPIGAIGNIRQQIPRQ